MTEKFSTAMYMDRGAEQLVEVLNHYISAIVESECPRALARTLSVPRLSVCVADDPLVHHCLALLHSPRKCA